MDSFWDFFWLLLWTFFIFAYLMLLFHIIGDLFRDEDLSGWAKAAWIIGLIFFPFLIALIYMIARGKGMAERQMDVVYKAQADLDQHIEQVAKRTDPAEQIASAKALLDNGTISEAEFARLKQKALA